MLPVPVFKEQFGKYNRLCCFLLPKTRPGLEYLLNNTYISTGFSEAISYRNTTPKTIHKTLVKFKLKEEHDEKKGNRNFQPGDRVKDLMPITCRPSQARYFDLFTFDKKISDKHSWEAYAKINVLC